MCLSPTSRSLPIVWSLSCCDGGCQRTAGSEDSKQQAIGTMETQRNAEEGALVCTCHSLQLGVLVVDLPQRLRVHRCGGRHLALKLLQAGHVTRLDLLRAL